MLRKKFKDPLSPNKDGEFQLLYLQNQATMGTPGPGQGSGGRAQGQARGRAGTRPGRGRRRDGPVALQSAARSGPSPSGRGAIVGVASKNTGQSIKTYKGKDHYNEWQFIGMEISTQGGAGRTSRTTRRGPQRGGPGGRDGGGGQRRRTRGRHHNHNTRRHLHASARRAFARFTLTRGPLAPHRAAPDGSAGWPCSRASDSRGS